MRLGFYYHIPAIIQLGKICVPGYLGRFLDDSFTPCISVDIVMCLIRSEQIDRLFNMAFDIKEKSKLYEMWNNEVFLD